MKQEVNTPPVLSVVHATIRPAVTDKFSIHLNPNADPKKVFESLEMCCEAYGIVTERTEHLKFVIAKSLVYIKQRKLYRPEFRTFGQFMAKRVEGHYGIARSTVYEGIRIAKMFPDLSIDEFARIGSHKLYWATKVVRKEHLEPVRVKALLKSAAALSIEDLSERFEAPGSKDVRVTLALRVTSRVARMFRKAMGDQDPNTFLSDLLASSDGSRHLPTQKVA